MSEVKVDGAALAKYEYDAMGRRIKRSRASRPS